MTAEPTVRPKSATRDLVRWPVTIIDLGMTNIGSVTRMLHIVGAAPTHARSADEVPDRTPIVLPGVGHFSAGVQALDARRLRGVLCDRHHCGCPVLGICLGAQLLCQHSEEGSGAGLGIAPTCVRRFPSRAVDGGPLAVPNVGWRPFAPPSGVLPFSVQPGRMYFTHSYYIEPSPDRACTPCTAEYGGHTFATTVRAGTSIGVQFHPEKSHRYGLAFLRSWLAWASEVSA